MMMLLSGEIARGILPGRVDRCSVGIVGTPERRQRARLVFNALTTAADQDGDLGRPSINTLQAAPAVWPSRWAERESR